LFGSGSEDRLVLEHDTLRVRVNPQTGGLLSVRRPEDRGNRLSQHLAIRTTRPPPAVGSPWEDPQERAEYGKATAESVTRTGERTILSRGHCSDSKGRKLLSFTQRVELLDGLPLARLDIEVTIDASAATAPGAVAALERYVACRFAWNENDDLDVVRSLHGQSVVSERTLITAPHFLSLRPVHAGGAADVNILTGGLPWHLRASPHILDSLLLAGDATTGKFTLAVGLGLARPWDAALDLIATGSLTAPPSAAPPIDHVVVVVARAKAAAHVADLRAVRPVAARDVVAAVRVVVAASAVGIDGLGRGQLGLELLRRRPVLRCDEDRVVARERADLVVQAGLVDGLGDGGRGARAAHEDQAQPAAGDADRVVGKDPPQAGHAGVRRGDAGPAEPQLCYCATAAIGSNFFPSFICSYLNWRI
jgi:hypothetical protein